MRLSKKIYSLDAVRIAAQILAPKLDVFLEDSTKHFEVTLKAKRKDVVPAQLEALAGEFGNELLNQEYRFIVGRFNSKISKLIVTQSLMAARGGQTPPALPPEELTAAFKAKVADLIKNAQDEVARTMPRKISPQGNPLPPAAENSSV